MFAHTETDNLFKLLGKTSKTLPNSTQHNETMSSIRINPGCPACNTHVAQLEPAIHSDNVSCACSVRALSDLEYYKLLDPEVDPEDCNCREYIIDAEIKLLHYYCRALYSHLFLTDIGDVSLKTDDLLSLRVYLHTTFLTRYPKSIFYLCEFWEDYELYYEGVDDLKSIDELRSFLEHDVDSPIEFVEDKQCGVDSEYIKPLIIIVPFDGDEQCGVDSEHIEPLTHNKLEIE